MKLLLCLLLQLPQTAPSSSPEVLSPESSAPANSLQQMVLQLQDPVFARRQAATAALLRLPESAAPLLLQAEASAEGETAARLAPILANLRRRWFRERLLRLAQAPTSADSAAPASQTSPASQTAPETTDFPEARLLLELLQDDSAEQPTPPGIPLTPPTSQPTPGNSESPAPAARSSAVPQLDSGLSSSTPQSVLLQLLNAEPEVFAASLYQPARVPELLETRSATLALDCDGREDRSFPTASALSLMLIASRPEIRLLRKTSANISRPLEDPRFDRLLQSGQQRSVLRKLVSAWIRRPGIAADRPLIFAIRHRLPAGRDVAVRVLQGEGRGPQLFYACMCLAALNSQADIPLLESRLNSSLAVWPPRGRTVLEATADSRLQVQFRDAALAALIHLRQLPPAQLGLKLIPSSDTLYRIDSTGAIADDVRIERIAIYRSATSSQAP